MVELRYTQAELLQRLEKSNLVRNYYVAYSGGMDSHVLLHSLVSIKDDLNCNIIAIHINHNLHDDAHLWADHCEAVCTDLGIELIRKEITSDCPKGESLEAWARDKRYEFFSAIVSNNDVLLTAQHKNDQAETLLLQMFRGAGVKGLSSMPAMKKFNNAFHARPLLDFTRDELKLYAQTFNLVWVEDESNENTSYNRNFIRHSLFPVINEKWPQASDTLVRVARHLAETNELMDDLAMIDLDSCREVNPKQLKVSKLKGLSLKRQKNVLRHWLYLNEVNMPSTIKLKHIIHDVIESSQDAQPELKIDKVMLRRYKDILMITDQVIPEKINNKISWDLNENCKLNLGELSAKKVKGEGIHSAVCKDNKLEVRFRNGGERICPAGNNQHKELKKILQDEQILPWLRDTIPLLYLNDELVSIAGFCNEQAYSAKKDQEGWKIEWSGLKEARLL